MKFHHVGVACRDINEGIAEMSKIHEISVVSKIVKDEQQNAELCMLTLADGVNIELIAGKQVEGFVKKGITYYHLCYEVENINTEIERLEKEGAYLLSAPKPAILFDNREVAFLHVSYGIIELLSLA
ncbi:VOC family protein [Mucilaginibacter hurinus]|uniref:VOC family protein n=2 Tax=Mucilaginibacter hurinus TaxID=2201324 RepID=A0A367GP90_9SPHI|nr:VOC family protein [Mucilaginibacter hurinus]